MSARARTERLGRKWYRRQRADQANDQQWIRDMFDGRGAERRELARLLRRAADMRRSASGAQFNAHRRNAIRLGLLYLADARKVRTGTVWPAVLP